MTDDRDKRYIMEFRGAYRFLSNFYPENEPYYKTAEHYFQAAKAATQDEHDWVMAAESPGKAKYRGRCVDLRPGWDDDKINVMTNVVREKFQDPTLRSWLDSTGNAELIEGNDWGDTFWGVDSQTGEGENHLGQILMQIRQENRDESG